MKANAAPNGMNGRWSVEVKIAKANYPFLANNFFGMFADVIATDPSLGPNGTAYQYMRPAGGYIGDDVFTALTDAKLPLPRWGNVTLDTSLFPAGLQITGFGNVGTDPSKISLTGKQRVLRHGGQFARGHRRRAGCHRGQRHLQDQQYRLEPELDLDQHSVHHQPDRSAANDQDRANIWRLLRATGRC